MDMRVDLVRLNLMSPVKDELLERKGSADLHKRDRNP